MTIETVEQAVRFISDYGNVGHPTELLETVPTTSQLQAARAECLRQVDSAFRLMSQFHGVDLPEVQG